MKDNYPDIHRLMQELFERDKYPESEVIVDLDGDDYSHQPLITWRTLNEGQFAHGLWNVILTVNVMFDLSDPAMDGLLPYVYAQVRSWDKPGQGVLADEKYGVESVEDGAVFDIINVANINGKDVSQYACQWRLTIKDWS